MHPQQHLYVDLPALRTIPFFHASPRWHRNAFARTDRLLAYSHRCWHAGHG